MPREYRHIEQYAKEISELQKQGYSQRQIGDRLGFDVYFTAFGLIDLPDETELLKTMEEIRKSA